MDTILVILSTTSISGLAHEYLDLSLRPVPCCSSAACTIVIVVATVEYMIDMIEHWLEYTAVSIYSGGELN